MRTQTPYSGTVGAVADVRLSELAKPRFRTPRTTSVDLHRHLRTLIIEGMLPPGTVLKQAELAREFDVSRTPMREAFRMLQEEGLIDADPNQRPRVRALDPRELENLYATRIVLESLAARISTGRLSADEVRHGHDLLRLMDDARAQGSVPEWLRAHREFHRICTVRASAQMEKAIASFGEQSERYLVAYQTWHPDAFRQAHHEHEALLAAVSAGDPDEAGALMAEHLSHTALEVIRDLSPGDSGDGIRHALTMATARRLR